MKKFISIALLIAVLVSLCACGAKEETQAPTQAPTETTVDPSSPEILYGHIDQTVPQDGVYKIWNAEGVKNMVNHPDAKFELLCNVDMGGEILAPIPEFTGTISGTNCTISNFTVQGDGTDFGFVSVNKGKISNLYLDQVTFVPGANAQNIGSLTGRNEGSISRCTVTGGTMTVENTAEGANCGSLAGVNTGTVSNSAATVDVSYCAANAATIGGIVGVADGGSMEYVDAGGKLTVTGSNKTVGLIAGEARNTSLTHCAFIGADNSQDGKLFYNFFGAEENVTYETLLWRDNSREPEDPKVQEKREKAVQAMYEMCTIEWHPERDIPHTCNCTLLVCNGVYSNTYTQVGLPYNHKAGSLARMKYCLNEDGTVKDWVYKMAEEGTFDTFDMYMGNDCSTCVQQAWLTVSNTIEFKRSSYQTPVAADYRNTGMLPIGQWEWDLGLDVTSAGLVTKNYTEANGPEVMYEAYALLRMGDGVGFYYENGHSRMVATDAVVVRDENGKIEPQYSYITCYEQGKQVIDDVKMTYSMCAVDQKYTFDNLYNGYYLPVTIEEFVTGEFDEPTCTLEGGLQEDNRFALTTGTVQANYSLDYVTMVITDEEGNEVFNHVMFPTVTKRLDNNSNDTQIRNVIMEYDLAGFAVPLKYVSFDIGGTYHATITGSLATGDDFVVKDFTFTNG